MIIQVSSSTAVTNRPAQNMSDIGRRHGDKHINCAGDEVHKNNACYCWHSVDLVPAGKV